MNGRAEIPDFRPADKAVTDGLPDEISVNEIMSWHTNSYTTTREELFRKAEAGDAKSQYDLGFLYDKGVFDGYPNYNEAGRWYQKAAVNGNSRAQYWLGRGYHFGDFGFPVNYKEALKWYTRGAKGGDADAQNSLGSWYLMGGDGVDQDHEEAVKWFTKAAEAGDSASQFHLGLCYRDGLGTDKDEKEAAKWFTKAAERGDEEAKKQIELLKSTKPYPVQSNESPQSSTGYCDGIVRKCLAISDKSAPPVWGNIFTPLRS
jgi:TPR repeat protein